MLSFMIIPVMAYAYRSYFSYYNGSDEQLYLTYQGGLSLLDSRTRWLSSHLVVFCNKIGLSGAQLNLFMDIFSPLALFAMTLLLLRKNFLISNYYFAAFLIVFGGVLFNQANPLLEGLLPDFRYSQTVWVSAFEGFATYIRSPEPQLSLLLALLVWMVFERTRIMVLPIIFAPVLYDNVALPYGYLLAVFIFHNFALRKKTFKLDCAVNIFVFIALSLGILLLDQMGFFAAYSNLPHHYRHTHSVTLSIPLIFGFITIAFMGCNSFFLAKSWTSWDRFVLSVVFLQLFITNHTLISGVSLFPQGLQSVAGTIGASIISVYFFNKIPLRLLWFKYLLSIVVGVMVVWSINNSQGLQLAAMRYRIQLFQDISADALYEYRKNPYSYIGPTQTFKGYIALAFPMQVWPMLAHQYYFPAFLNACEPIAELNAKAAVFLNNNKLDPRISPYIEDVNNSLEQIDIALTEVKRYRNICPNNVPADVKFRIFEEKDNTSIFIYFMPFRIARQGIDF